MEEAISAIFNINLLIFAVGIAIATMAIRKVVETTLKKIEIVLPDNIDDLLQDIWTQWVMRALPIVLGGVAMYFLKDFPVPDIFVNSVSGRVFWGMFGGLVAMPIFSIVKFHIKKHLPESVKKKVEDVKTSIFPKPPVQ